MPNVLSRRSGFLFGALLLTVLPTAFLMGSCCGNNDGNGLLPPGTTVPDADFTATPTTGPRPLDVAFTNTSTGTITTFLWDFGDGTTSTEENPQHQYDNTGTYDVKLEVTGPDGKDFLTVVGLIKVILPLGDPSFEAQTPGEAPEAPWLTFFGPGGNQGHVILSAAGGPDIGMPTEGQLWCEIGAESTDPGGGKDGLPTNSSAGITQDFTFPQGRPVLQLNSVFINAEGPNQFSTNDFVNISVSDGSNSVSIYRRDTFSATEGTSGLHPGQPATPNEVVTANLEQLFKGANFKSLLTLKAEVANDGDGFDPSHAYLDHVRFEAPAPPLAVSFVADDTSVVLGTPIHFTDLTVATPTSWSWDFGDGVASSLQNPDHTYAQTGVYEVLLRASVPGAAGELQIADYITVTGQTGTVDFRVRVRRAQTNQVLLYTNLSNGPFVDWTWTFGDGQSAFQTVQSTPIFHAYASPGLYSVGLSGTLPDSSVVAILKPDFVRVQDPPAIISQPQSLTIFVGQTADFHVVATGTSIHYEWRRNGTPIAGAPDLPDYTTPATTGANQGDFYSCRVFNVVGTVTSTPAFLNLIL